MCAVETRLVATSIPTRLLSLRAPRAEDGALMILVELTLVLVYTSVLLIKACDTSAEVCKTFGLGDAADGQCAICFSLFHCVPIALAPLRAILSFSTTHDSYL